MGILGASFFHKSQRFFNCVMSTFAKPSMLMLNSLPLFKAGTPGTLELVSFSLFGSPVTKNEANAPVYP